MKIPEYITVEEVKRVCHELKLRDWTQITEPDVSRDEAELILSIVNTKGMNIDIEDFKEGLEVELEHGTRYEEANVTNNHPILTGMIVLAHLNETLDYYKRIDVAEIEGDLLQAILQQDAAKVKKKYAKLAEAQQRLHSAIQEQLQ
ncbi:MAG: DUF5661 family protein [Thermodesulfobacteriota bacterium]|nr:DUF5661 family protein [Thermodesulfobacteriota bacterium]